ncbi:unnamed protein product [Adineta steineri]|uniref:Uncharacterized protein n=1 Tax=Adineta steineri TaxID=433720 RepID=A0A819ZVT0_9BILA|nr:unnamed protein product [Adineta steineri]CAF4073089.1 unnamed protein product [Adineta steineri]CAF4181204.1 unnamed protein product [Adineta steineri]
MIYTFRFNISDKVVHLTQQELQLIPFLFNVVVHKDNFLSIQNDNGEYVLNYPIQYTWFKPILRSVTSEQPYTLFNELSEDDNVLDTLRLFDYLAINSFQVPHLKNENLVRSDFTRSENNDGKRVQYHQANLFEARQTATEFIIALSKIEYNLCDLHTIQRAFSLIKVILSSAPVFSSRFRHHTLTVAKTFCYSFFSIKQQRLLPTAQQIAQHSKFDSFIYLYEDDQSLPDNFQNVFTWKGVYMQTEENHIGPLSASSKKTFAWSDIPLSPEINLTEPLSAGSNSTMFSSQCFEQRHMRIYEPLGI